MYSVHNRRFKATFAERIVKTFKQKLYRVMTHYNTHRYLDFLDDITLAYNNTPHSGILNAIPNIVHQITDRRVLDNLVRKMIVRKQQNYGLSGLINSRRHQLDLSLKNILEAGSSVRLLANAAEAIFKKAYRPIYTIKIFLIDKVNYDANPITYTLKDLNNEPIKGIVYRNEIIPVSKPQIFDIEKILKKRNCQKTKRTQILVKYLGYPDTFNQWLYQDELINK